LCVVGPCRKQKVNKGNKGSVWRQKTLKAKEADARKRNCIHHSKQKAEEPFMATLLLSSYKEEKHFIHSFIHIQLHHQNTQIHIFCSVSLRAPSTQHHQKIITITLTVITSAMQLGNSISNTMKFLHKTLENFKSCFFPRYQKLPKTPPQNQFLGMDNNNYKDLEKFYSDFTEQWDSGKEKGRQKSKKKGKEVPNESVVGLNNARHDEQKMKKSEEREECEKKKQKGLTNERVNQKKDWRGNGNYCMVEKKLREMEMLEMSDVDYVLDIEEVLHYYSRITCPMYLEIVDKFLVEMYSEFNSCCYTS